MRRLNLKGAGFTLLEVLVAMAIFALTSWLAYGGLRQVLMGREMLLPRLAEQAALVRTVTLLSNDFNNLVPRSIRDPLGTPVAALRTGAGTTEPLVSLTRVDAALALLEVQPELYRVDYRLTQDTLVREVWPVLDPLQNTTPNRQTLLRGVRSFGLRFMAGRVGSSWVNYWPPSANDNELEQLPRGIEFTLQFMDGTTLRRVLMPVAAR